MTPVATATREPRDSAGAPTLLAQTGQMSTGEANRLLSLGRAMADADAGLGDEVLLVGASGGAEPEPRVLFEAITRAVAAGTLAPEKAAMIRQLLETLSAPSVELERSLVKLAVRITSVELGRRCDRELEADHEALRDRDRRHKARRYAAFFREGDGMVGFRGRLDAVTAAPFVTWIEGEVRKQMGTERELPDGERRDEGQIRADVFAAMANHAMGCQDPASGTKTVMVVQVTKEALESGVGTATCHGLSGPISIEALRQFAVDLAIMPAVMGGGSLPMDLGRATRCFTPAQRIAIALRDKGCAKCGAAVNRCDVHHIRFWSLDGLSRHRQRGAALRAVSPSTPRLRLDHRDRRRRGVVHTSRDHRSQRGNASPHVPRDSNSRAPQPPRVRRGGSLQSCAFLDWT